MAVVLSVLLEMVRLVKLQMELLYCVHPASVVSLITLNRAGRQLLNARST